MSIFIMDGKTFQKVFAKKEDPDKILKARYIIVSSRIRTMESEFDNVQKANTILFPTKEILSDSRSADRDYFDRVYKRQLKNSFPTLCLMRLRKRKPSSFYALRPSGISDI